MRLSWRIDEHARAGLEEEIFGQRILVTDHDDWPLDQVIDAYRSQEDLEAGFRQAKDPHVVSFAPIRHFTDHKIAAFADWWKTTAADRFTKIAAGALHLTHVLAVRPARSELIRTHVDPDRQALLTHRH